MSVPKIIAVVSIHFGHVLSISKPLCTFGDHRYGEWIPYQTDEIPYPCCADYWPANSHFCGEHGGLMGGSIGHACQCAQYYNNSTETYEKRILPMNKYIWQTDRCELLPWKDLNFCELLGSRKIFLVGDSVMDITRHSLLLNVWSQPTTSPNCLQRIGGSQLHNMPANQGDSHDAVYHHVKMFSPDIIVFSHGAHSPRDGKRVNKHEDDINLDRAYLQNWHEEIAEILIDIHRYISEEGSSRNITVIYATESSGISGCVNYKVPLKNPIKSTDWNWNTMTWYNDYAVHHFPSMGIPVIDLSPLDLRPDSKVGSGTDGKVNDCLHPCLPGPLDLFSRILAQMMLTKEI